MYLPLPSKGLQERQCSVVKALSSLIGRENVGIGLRVALSPCSKGLCKCVATVWGYGEGCHNSVAELGNS